MYKPFWALLFILSCTYSAAFADDPTSEKLSDLYTADGSCKGWGVAPAPSENECRSFIEAALKEQRHAEAGGGGDAVEDASTIAPEDQINQVNEETTADASTENIESTVTSDAVEETNERVETSGTEPEEPETSIELEQAVTDSANETPAESIEAPEESTEELVTESAETESTSTAEAEGVPAEFSAAETEESTASVEAEGTLTDAEPEEVLSEAEETVTESAETVTESAEAEAVPTESAEAEAAPIESEAESIEETPSDVTEKEMQEQLEKELAESVEGESEQITEETISAEDMVRDGGDGAAEDVLPETEPEEPMSNEEPMLGDQPVEQDASGEAPLEQETEISQEVGSEQVEEQTSVEQEETSTEQPEVQEAEPEEIVQETAENVDAPVTEEVPIASEAVETTNEVLEPSEEQQTRQDIDNTENVQSPSEETNEVHEQSSETQESPETINEELPVTAEEATPITAEEPSTTNVVVEETPAESAASVEQESAPEHQTEEVSEQQAEAVAVADEVMEEETPEQEDLTLNIEIPENLRSRSHISEVLRLDVGSIDTEAKLLKAEESTLKELKRVYEAAIKPLEILYKYRDLSNRHFGDPEIFSKPLILFMGPWSGGKSTIINYLLDNEYKQTALRTGAEPSPAYFNIVMHGEREEVMDGTQLAADWTFSGLQKFGQGLLDRLRGLKLNSPLLEKVNIVEIPGILEIRKQVERLFPLNDACQWFIDRADVIFLVYDPSKLDVGPETEAILDQLKGREYQTKIILNKADQVKPEELMRVQGTLIWNISPLMSSTEPPVMYSTSLWSHPYQPGSPSRLLFAQEKAFLKDLRSAMEKRVENKISSARRFAVRVRNHAKMVDCYLTTYYNHKTFFGNKEKVSEDIIEHPQNYHIYEGLSTLTNISRYDLPDPDVYKDFFRLNPVYDFQQLASTCTYFKGCPINRLDVAIAYDLPELVGRYKKAAEDVKSQGKK